RYSIRFRADKVPGYKLAWLLWPDSETWPRDGEIDFPEGDAGGPICAYLHYAGGTSPHSQDVHCSEQASDTWHTASIEWTSTAATFILDGDVVGRSTARIPDVSMHWVIQTETLVHGPPPAAGVAGHIQIDWVAIYSPA